MNKVQQYLENKILTSPFLKQIKKGYIFLGGPIHVATNPHICIETWIPKYFFTFYLQSALDTGFLY